MTVKRERDAENYLITGGVFLVGVAMLGVSRVGEHLVGPGWAYIIGRLGIALLVSLGIAGSLHWGEKLLRRYFSSKTTW